MLSSKFRPKTSGIFQKKNLHFPGVEKSELSEFSINSEANKITIIFPFSY